MEKKYKLRKKTKIVSLIIIISIILLIFIIKLNLKKSYSIDYKIDEFNITENYSKTDKVYFFKITYEEQTFSLMSSIKYQRKNKIIKEIEPYTEGETTCLKVMSEDTTLSTVCTQNSEQIDSHLITDYLKEQLEINEESENVHYENDKYKIYNNEHELLIWQYKGFDYFENNLKDHNFLELFSKDIYSVPLTAIINDYLFIPDYEQNYVFNKAFVINLKKQKIEEWELDYDISYDSYILGVNEKSIYLVDKKSKIEYELVPHKQKMRIVGTVNKKGIIYQNGKAEKVSLTKLVNENQKFTYKHKINYHLEDGTLYKTYLEDDNKIKISNEKVDKIILTREDDIYYLSKDTIYKYNEIKKERKLIEYSELEFNSDSLIFIN